MWHSKIHTGSATASYAGAWSLEMESLGQLVAARKLRWAGHVARMGHERLPRRSLTAWVR